MKNSKRNGAFAVGFPLACLWFGYHVGPTLSSGSLSMKYFIGYGVQCFLFPLITYAIGGFFLYFGMKAAYVYKAGNYAEYMHVLYPKHYKAISPLWNLNQIINDFIGFSSMLAFGGAMLNTWFDIPVSTGSVICALICFLLIVKGLDVLKKSSTLLSILLIAGILITAVLMVYNFGGNISAKFQEHWRPDNANTAVSLRKSIVYGFSAMAGIIKMVNYSGEINNRKQAAVFAVGGSAMAAITVMLTCIIMLPYIDDLLLVGTPIVYELKMFISQIYPWLYPVYTVLLFLAMLTSAPMFLMNEVNRWIQNKKLFPENGRVQSMWLRRLLVFVVFTGVTFAISLLGFDTIINVFYQYCGYVAMPMVAIPIILSIPRVRRKEKELAAEK